PGTGQPPPDSRHAQRVHPVKDAEPRCGPAGPGEQDLDDDETDETAAPFHTSRSEVTPPDQGQDQEDEGRKEDGVAEPRMGAEPVRHRILSDRSLVVRDVDGMKGAVGGQTHLDDDCEGNERGPDPKCAVQTVLLRRCPEETKPSGSGALTEPLPREGIFLSDGN